MWKVIVTTFLIEESKYLSHVTVFPDLFQVLEFIDRMHKQDMHIVNVVINSIS
jgi:hypothetical protein